MDHLVTKPDEFLIEHISIYGHDVAYRCAGQGPVLSLLHGIAGSSQSF